MDDVFVATAAVVVTLAWIPFCRRFYQNWIARRNPISLAIFALIVFVMFSTIGEAVWLVLLREPDVAIVTLVLIAMQASVCGFFYLSFYRAKARFDRTRD